MTCHFMREIAVQNWVWILLAWAAAAVGTGVAPRAGAQDAPAANVPPATGSTVEEVQPRGMYLRNEKGELVYVPDFPYEQFERLLKIERNLVNLQRPAFVVTNLVIDARVTGTRVEAHATFTLEERGAESDTAGEWFRVPLRFGDSFLVREPEFDGPGEHFLTFEGVPDGYACWLQRGSDRTLHTVKLHLYLPLELVGNESRVAMSLPAPLASTLTLEVPEVAAEGVVRDVASATGRPLTFESLPEGRGQFLVRGIRGDVSLTWHASRPSEEESDVRLDVLGAVTVTADERLQEIRADGSFVVRGFGGPLDTFRARLPPGLRFRESPEPGYEVRLLPAEEEGAANSQIVEIRLDRPTTGEASIRLLAEVPATGDDSAATITVSRLVDEALLFEPARFEFIGAVRHRGHVDVIVQGDWAVEDRDDPDFARVDPGSIADGSQATVARFRYHNQQRALQISIRQKPTRISVEPTYDVYVDAQQARLRAKLVCRTSGSRAAPLAVRLPFWTVEVVRFPDVEGLPPVDVSETNPLVVPIPVEVQAARQFTLEIEARQDMTASVVSGTGPLRVVLPLLEATNPSRAHLAVSPATVTIVAADNVLLTPRPQQLKALSPLMGSSVDVVGAGDAAGGAAGQVSPDGATGQDGVRFRYRDRGTTEQAVFVGDMKVQPQVIAARVASTVTMSRSALSVEQRLAYVVLHEPVETLSFTLTEALAGDARYGLRILLQDQPLFPTFEPSTGVERARAWVRLPRPMLGPFELRVVQARQTLPALSVEASAALPLPLLLPATRGASNTTIVDNTLTLLPEETLRVEVGGSAWTAVESESGSGRLVLATTGEGGETGLRVSLRSAPGAGSTILRQLWIQSWLSGQQRRDRVVFGIRATESQVRVVLPREPQAAMRLLKVAVDHEELGGAVATADGAIVIPLPPSADAGPHEHVVELWYVCDVPASRPGSLTLEAASIDALDQVERTYWQVVLPRSQILVGLDPAVTAEMQWRWDGFGWRRQSSRDQAELEQWTDASRQDPPAPGTNRYLFATFGSARRLEITTAYRSWILLAASGGVFAVGLMLLYVPLLRHPAWLLATAVLVGGVGLMVPELAILMAQAAALGALLVVMVPLFGHWLARSPRAMPLPRDVRARSDSKLRAGSGWVTRAEGSSRSTPASTALPSQLPATDSKS